MNQNLSHQLELENRERRSIELTYELEKINQKIAKLRLEKEQKELDLIELMGHNLEGSKSYDLADRVVTLKTDMIYSLDKKSYVKGDVYIPDEWDPVLQNITYEVNKKLFNQYEQTAPESVKEILNALITKKPSKPNVTIKVRS